MWDKAFVVTTYLCFITSNTHSETTGEQMGNKLRIPATADDMLAEIVSEYINDIESLVNNNDRITLEEWLAPLLANSVKSTLGLSELDSVDAYNAMKGYYIEQNGGTDEEDEESKCLSIG